MWVWTCFVIGFGIDFFMSWGSEGDAEVVEKCCIWSCFLIGFCIDFFMSSGSKKVKNSETKKVEKGEK